MTTLTSASPPAEVRDLRWWLRLSVLSLLLSVTPVFCGIAVGSTRYLTVQLVGRLVMGGTSVGLLFLRRRWWRAASVWIGGLTVAAVSVLVTGLVTTPDPVVATDCSTVHTQAACVELPLPRL